jgi:hypothetical protein
MHTARDLEALTHAHARAKLKQRQRYAWGRVTRWGALCRACHLQLIPGGALRLSPLGCGVGSIGVAGGPYGADGAAELKGVGKVWAERGFR